MSNSLSRHSNYSREKAVQSSRNQIDSSALDSLRNEFYHSWRPDRLLFQQKNKHSSNIEKSAHSYKKDRSNVLFDKFREYQAEKARNKHFKGYERYKYFKDGTEITRESVCKRLPETNALKELRKKAVVKEDASREEQIAAAQAKTTIEIYEEACYRRALCLRDKGIIKYDTKLAEMAKANSEKQDQKNKCGHFVNMMHQIAGYGFNNGYSVVMGWMTSPGHRKELLDINNDAMGASQICAASTINFGQLTA